MNKNNLILNKMNNSEFIQKEIQEKKKFGRYYFPTSEQSSSVITDQDHFPYKRYFRGVYDSPYPTIMEREAGFRPRNDNCYKPMGNPEAKKVDYCWQYPCSTVFPCKPDKELNFSP